MSSKLTVYGLEASPPVRAVLLLLKALDLPYDFVQVNLFAGEHVLPEYLEKNPQHTIPTLEDDGNFLWDSHAIMTYLVTKYGQNDALYPLDPLQRAVVEQRLHFDTGELFTRIFKSITFPLLYLNETGIPQRKLDELLQVYDMVEVFLADHDYIAGNQLTIADFSFVATLTTLEVYLEFDAVKHLKLIAWLERMKELPYYEESNANGARQFAALIKSKNFTIIP